jgi:hypothetical protein
MNDLDSSYKNFNDRMINKIDEILSTLSRLPQKSFNILSYKINEPQPMSGLGYTVSLKSDNHDIITIEITNIDHNEINQFEKEKTNTPETMTGGFNLDDTLQMKLTIEDNISIPLEQILESCEMIAKTNMIPYVKIVDNSKLNYCESAVVMDYSLLHILSYGVSWYSQHGYISIHHKHDTDINNQTINGTMGSLLDKLYGTAYISGMSNIFNNHIHNIDNATFSMDMKVSDFFKQILNYFDSLLEDPNKISKLCNSDKSIDYSEYSKSIILVFNEINHICNRLNEKMTDNDNFDLLSYDRTLFKKVINSEQNINMDTNSQPDQQESDQQESDQQESDQQESAPEESAPEESDQQESETEDKEESDQQESEPEDKEEFEPEDKEESDQQESEPEDKEETKENSEETNNIPGVYVPNMAGGSSYPNVDLIRKPFSGGGKTLKRKNKNKTNKKIKINKNKTKNSRNLKNKTKKWNFFMY